MQRNSIKAEEKRLGEANSHEKDWKLWGSYVAERAWGTVREDYSPDGAAWNYFPFEQAVSKTFRWNEDGIAGICDRKQNLCFAVSMWNEKDEILKERFFGLDGNTGNHGEDVKEYYFYLDNTPIDNESVAALDPMNFRSVEVYPQTVQLTGLQMRPDRCGAIVINSTRR